MTMTDLARYQPVIDGRLAEAATGTRDPFTLG